jgi:hypothetical protein
VSMKVAKSKPPHAVIPQEHLKTSSSIPTKFETQINPNASERNGFMNRTYRFGSSESDVPGAGHYHQSTTLIRTNQSTSAKGYTAMASTVRNSHCNAYKCFRIRDGTKRQSQPLIHQVLVTIIPKIL